jgi:hypothetical protein
VVVIGLLLAGVACLVLGVLFASTPWLIASMAAAAAAALVLYRGRSRATEVPLPEVEASAATVRPTVPDPAPVATAVVTGTAFAGRSDVHGDRSAAVTADAKVWVVDGRAAYHLGQCPLLDDVPAGVVPERIPVGQAVEDGFVACPACDPTDERILAGSAASVDSEAPAPRQSPAAQEQVWVVDGRPLYHRAGCPSLAGQPAEVIAHRQAVEDGFAPCSVCADESGLR